MKEYFPDTWTIVKITTKDKEVIYKVFAAWHGGYACGDSWKLSSGIAAFEDKGCYYKSPQDSGSTYILKKQLERLSVYQLQLLSDWSLQLEAEAATIEIISSADYLKLVF